MSWLETKTETKTGVLHDGHRRRRLRTVVTRLIVLLSNSSLDVQVQQLELVSHTHTHIHCMLTSAKTSHTLHVDQHQNVTYTAC